MNRDFLLEIGELVRELRRLVIGDLNDREAEKMITGEPQSLFEEAKMQNVTISTAAKELYEILRALNG